MEPIAPLVAISGGLLIGIAAALLLLLAGRIAGVSGMLATASTIGAGGAPRSQAVAFVAGLPLGATLIAFLVRKPDLIVTSSVPLLIIAGLLVGFGTRLGNGCTSGHGVCGIARLSHRSIAATATFMASAALVVFIQRHVVGG
ncbi:YeeE/YedE family protein [Allosphingosinicella vermicomposti]|uniref:YeeE/YedE family protein n=1 Tax=Allosphingosinicella vermicomposti TaxID=614671 RepID=UPI001FE01B95|nr:YeeE/YedE thiosulfate transporter family protein [Allosphingosinicella vermicomposti]